MDEHRTTPSTPNSNIEDVPKDFVDVLFTMPQENGIGHLTDDTIQGVIMVNGTGNGECRGYFYNSELFMFRRICKFIFVTFIYLKKLLYTKMFKTIVFICVMCMCRTCLEQEQVHYHYYIP